MTNNNTLHNSYKKRNTVITLLPTAVLAIFCHTTVNAQEKAPAERQSRNRMLEEVVVTATKRAENLQDVPISVAAFSGDMLAAMGVDDPTDLQAITPGLTYNSATGFSIVYLRGVGSDAYLMADPSVATYIDGVYYPFSSGLAQSFGRVERIEVLKGPQGTLFGRNTTGGAISITTEKPNIEEFYGSIEASYGSFDTKKASGLINIPITDHWATTLAVFHNLSDNYYTFDSDSIQQGIPEEVAKGYRLKTMLAYENFDVLLATVRVDQSGFNTALAPNTNPSALTASLGGEKQARNHTASVNAPINFDIDSTVYFAETNFRFNKFDSKLILSKQSLLNPECLTDFDGTNAPIISFGSPTFSDVKTAELQFISNEDSWGSSWLEWIGGFYYIDSVAGLDPKFSLFGGEHGDVLGIPISDVLALLPTPLSNLLNSVPLTGGVNLGLHGLLSTESTAAFLQTTFKLTDWAELTLGGRYQEEQRIVLKSSTQILSGDDSETTLFDWANDGVGDTSVESTNFSPKVALNFYPNDALMIYLSWQEGYKSGTFNTINVTDDIDYAEPEDVVAYELGAKYSNSNGFTLNGAIFQTEIENIQVQFTSLLNGGAVTFENAGAGRIRGIDFDSKILVFPSLVDDLVFSLSGAYLDAIYTDYKNGSGFDEETGIFVGGQDFTGNRMVRTPEYTATMAISKTFMFKPGPLEVTVDGYYNSGYPYQAQNTLFFEEEYYLINARASFLIEEWDLRITASGKNLNDAVYAYSQFPNDFGRLEALAPPTNYSLALQWNF
jgi:iron complex outermembrane receptor protein